MEQISLISGSSPLIWKRFKPIQVGGLLGALIGGKPVNAYRCPKCGRVELTTETK